MHAVRQGPESAGALYKNSMLFIIY